jgi:hypothetical protein
MSRHKQEWVSGLLDGELKGPRRWFVARHVRACLVCATEYRRQRNVRKMLRENQPATQMSDSPEFFWSKIKAEINRRAGETIDAPVPALGLADWLGQRTVAVASIAAALLIALGTVWLARRHRPVALAQGNYAVIERIATAIPNTVATAFEAPDADVTVIWVSGLPWTPDMTEMKTQFANLDT